MVGAQLFERSTRKVALTAAGQAFLEHVEKLPQLLDDAIQASRRAERGEAGVLRLGYTGRASHSQLPHLLARLRTQYPDILLDLEGPLPTGALRIKLLEQELDAALCFLPVEGKGLVTKATSEIEFAIALPTTHSLARLHQISLQQLEAEPFVAYPAGQGFHLRLAMEKICQSAGFVPRVVRESEASQTLLCLIAAGVGIGLIPREIESMSTEGIVFRPLSPKTLRLQHGLVWHTANTNPACTRLLDIFDQLKPLGR